MNLSKLSPDQEEYANQDWVNEDPHLKYEHETPYIRRSANTPPFLDWAQSHGIDLIWSEMLHDYKLGNKEWNLINRKVRLTDKQKKYIYLNFWEGKNLREIASEFDTSFQNVHMIVRAGLKKISRALMLNNIFSLHGIK